MTKAKIKFMIIPNEPVFHALGRAAVRRPTLPIAHAPLNRTLTSPLEVDGFRDGHTIVEAL